MVNATYHKETFRFRFTNLTSSVALRLRGSILHIELQSRRPEVILLVLDEGSDLEPLYKFLDAEVLDPKTYGVWVSVVSSRDHDGVSLPQFILNVVRRTNCGVDFSFVASLEDDDGTDETDSHVSQ
jgi:hypothetical protein